MKDTRTKLEERLEKGPESSPEKISYSIIRCRQPGYGGFESDRIEARVLEEHYLIIHTDTVRGVKTPIGIVDIARVHEAILRMYREATTVAEEVARRDENLVLDFTSKRTGELPSEAQYYV